MGYRSDVRIMTTKKGFEQLKEFVEQYINEHSNNEETISNLLEQCDVNKHGENVCYFGWNYLKWYDGIYKDVDAIMEGINYLGENEYSYRYSRIGENYDDIEERSYDADRDGEYELDYPIISRIFEDKYHENLVDVNKEQEDKDEVTYE